MRKIVILHTCDLHNRLTPAQAEFIADRKRSEENALLLDAGDAIRAGNIGWTPGGEPILRTMTAIGYDAMCIGNREFHLKAAIFPKKTADAGFPTLSASIRRRRPDSNAYLPPESVILERGGVKIGIFGITVPMIVQRMLAANLSDYLFDQPIEVAKRMVAKLRSEVDLLIAVAHIGKTHDREVAEACQEIDIIVAGHAHKSIYDPIRVGDVPIVAAGYFSRHLGRAEMEVGQGRAQLIDWQALRLPRE